MPVPQFENVTKCAGKTSLNGRNVSRLLLPKSPQCVMFNLIPVSFSNTRIGLARWRIRTGCP